MAKLVCSLDEAHLGDYPLNKDKFTIGRRPSNDMHLDNLAISGNHAVVTTIAGSSYIEDLKSTNGIIINHEKVIKHFLQHNDLIEIGQYKIHYLE